MVATPSAKSKRRNNTYGTDGDLRTKRNTTGGRWEINHHLINITCSNRAAVVDPFRLNKKKRRKNCGADLNRPAAPHKRNFIRRNFIRHPKMIYGIFHLRWKQKRRKISNNWKLFLKFGWIFGGASCESHLVSQHVDVWLEAVFKANSTQKADRIRPLRQREFPRKFSLWNRAFLLNLRRGYAFDDAA